MKKSLILLLLLISSAIFAQDSSLKGKNVELKADKDSTTIVNTGDGTIIGETGQFIKNLSASKGNSITNSSISATENLTIKATNHGTVIVLTGSGKIIYQTNKAAVKRLGVAEKTLATFFAILQTENVPVEDWQQKLEDIAQNYQRLQKQVAELQTNSDEGKRLKTEAEKAIDNGEFDRAKQLLEQAAQSHYISGIDDDALRGAIARIQLRYIESGESYQRAAEILLILGDKQKEKASDYLDLAAQGFYFGGKYTEAVNLYNKAMENGKNIGKNKLARILNNLANVYKTIGNYDKAQDFFEQALKLREKILGNDHLEVAITLNNIGDLYLEKNQYKKALLTLERALDIEKKILDVDDDLIITTRNNIASLHQKNNNYKIALKIYNENLIFLGKNRKESTETIQILNNMAALYSAQGDINKAEACYNRALGIFTKIYGDNHPQIVYILNNLASLYSDNKQSGKAIEIYKKVIRIFEENISTTHLNLAITFNNLATIYQDNGQYDEALLLYNKSINIKEKFFKEDSMEIANALNTLALLHFKMNNYSKSEEYLRKVLKICEIQLGKNDTKTQYTQQNLDLVLQKLKQQ